MERGLGPKQGGEPCPFTPDADGLLSGREAVPANPLVTLGEPLRIEVGDDDDGRARQPGEMCLIAFGPVPRRAVGLGFEGAEAGLRDQFPRAGRGAAGPDRTVDDLRRPVPAGEGAAVDHRQRCAFKGEHQRPSDASDLHRKRGPPTCIRVGFILHTQLDTPVQLRAKRLNLSQPYSGKRSSSKYPHLCSKMVLSPASANSAPTSAPISISSIAPECLIRSGTSR